MITGHLYLSFQLILQTYAISTKDANYWQYPEAVLGLNQEVYYPECFQNQALRLVGRINVLTEKLSKGYNLYICIIYGWEEDKERKWLGTWHGAS